MPDVLEPWEINALWFHDLALRPALEMQHFRTKLCSGNEREFLNVPYRARSKSGKRRNLLKTMVGAIGFEPMTSTV